MNRNPSFAASITNAASKQTYYTIRFLVDRARVEDAYRSYAYFRWVDDILDVAADSGSMPDQAEEARRRVFLERQKSLLEKCLAGEIPEDINNQERLLVELVQSDREKNSGLKSYLRHMMLVMDFDVRRRGRQISLVELNEYTRWLAIAVTENMHHFIGHEAVAPRDETRYLAVTAAHIIHMLRDTYIDLENGYINVPREVLDNYRITPQDIHSEAYCAWVRNRVDLAHEYFEAGKLNFLRMQNFRHRLAGLAYIARFEWLLKTIEQEGYHLRPDYSERKSLGASLSMIWLTLSSLLRMRGLEPTAQPSISQRRGKA
jgi:phytoene/squalene synthetase